MTKHRARERTMFDAMTLTPDVLAGYMLLLYCRNCGAKSRCKPHARKACLKELTDRLNEPADPIVLMLMNIDQLGEDTLKAATEYKKEIRNDKDCI